MIDCYIDKVVFVRCCLATQAEKLRDRLALGKQCSSELLNLGVKNAMLKVLMQYNNCSEDNCLTETQANTILEKLLYFCKKQCGYKGIDITTQPIENIPNTYIDGGLVL
jgi:hypothetical protein